MFINVLYKPCKALLARVSFFNPTINLPSVCSIRIISGIVRSNVPNFPFTITFSFVTLISTVAGILIGNHAGFTYDYPNNSLTSTENINLSETSEVYKIGGTEVLSSTTLGTGVTISNIRSVNPGLIYDRNLETAESNDYILFYDLSDGLLKKSTICFLILYRLWSLRVRFLL